MHPRNFFAELKRRNVYKVAVAYGVVGWLVVQIATQTFPFFDIPNWAVRLVVLLTLAGFPIALVIAWAFELTPQGLKRTEVADATAGASKGHTWLYVALFAAAASIGLFFLGRFTASTKTSSPTDVIAKSIAVMPFANLSEDKANAYFASGMQDEILTRLSAMDELKVISRTSTEKYRSHPEDLKKISAELGVATVLEGTVQKSGEAVHINVQLIDARTDTHLWARSYDRDLKNIFSVEEEVAEQVANALKLKLSNAQSEAVPTKDPEAYDLYLRAIYAHLEWFRGAGDPEEVVRLMREAVARDPTFVKARARLSIYETQKFSSGIGMTESLAEDARSNAQKAMALAPDLPESIAAMGLVYLWLDRDYPKAITYFEKAHEKEPGSDSYLLVLSLAQISMGHWKEAIDEMRRAVELNPRSAHGFETLGTYYAKTRQYEQALGAYDRALELDPKSWAIAGAKAELLLAQGQVEAAHEILEKIPRQVGRTMNTSNIFQMRWKCAFFTRDFSRALSIATEALSAPLDSVEAGDKELLMAQAELALGHRDKAMPLLEESRRKVAAFLVSHSDFPELHERLARIQMARHEKAAAMGAADKAIALVPLDKDANRGLDALETKAEVHAQFGDAVEAINLIKQLLETEGAGLLMTRALLRSDPVWDPLRSQPGFQGLVQEKP